MKKNINMKWWAKPTILLNDKSWCCGKSVDDIVGGYYKLAFIGSWMCMECVETALKERDSKGVGKEE